MIEPVPVVRASVVAGAGLRRLAAPPKPDDDGSFYVDIVAMVSNHEPPRDLSVVIGATAHYVTADLDEGPIIEQDVERVDHTVAPDSLTAIGADVERRALARAVRWHAEHRVLLNGHRTIVFK